MAEQLAALATQGISAPPIHPANKVAITVQPTDLIISLGTSRLAFDASGNSVGSGVQYIASFSVSATTAQQLKDLLEVTLSKYEEAFGAIPKDPKVTAKLATLGKQTLIEMAAPARAPGKKTRAATKKSSKKA